MDDFKPKKVSEIKADLQMRSRKGRYTYAKIMHVESQMSHSIYIIMVENKEKCYSRTISTLTKEHPSVTLFKSKVSRDQGASSIQCSNVDVFCKAITLCYFPVTSGFFVFLNK